jgi:hypothetical protein
MVGLLADSFDDPREQALLTLGLGLMGTPGSFSRGLSTAGQQALGVYSAGRQRQRANLREERMDRREDARDTQAQAAFQLQQQMAQLQYQQAQAEAAKRAALQGALERNRLSPAQVGLGAGAAAGSVGPTPGNLDRVQAAAPGFNRQGFLGDLWGIDPTQAIAMETAMRKEQAKLKETRTQIDPATNQPVDVMYFDDGTTKVVPYGSKPDIQLLGLGNRTEAVDKNRVKPGSIWQQGMDPGSAASNQLARERLTFDKSQVGKPTFQDGMWLTPPTAANPTGTATRVPGFEKALNEVQGNATGFGIKAQNALNTFDELEKVSTFDAYKRNVPYGSAEWALSSNGKRAINAERQFVAAVLRKESGAVISDEEYKTYGDQYFPRVTDGPEQLAQKALNRKSAILVLRAQAGSEGVRQMERAVGELDSDRRAQKAPQAPAAPAGGSDADFMRYLQAQAAAEARRRQQGGR